MDGFPDHAPPGLLTTMVHIVLVSLLYFILPFYVPAFDAVIDMYCARLRVYGSLATVLKYCPIVDPLSYMREMPYLLWFGFAYDLHVTAPAVHNGHLSGWWFVGAYALVRFVPWGMVSPFRGGRVVLRDVEREQRME
ncbi:hypothetical protein BDZ85DRAFT_257084 [Elsinoe ampelina]|uniref:Uncharacterized protein n=1 Tax=Elsinoe ampelina TaxID=302913 RepID=A0A6A6GMZ8_9PEZI|nr:hypothetical protein BDZ85DRAFT_257084 [Elsinoe ampelina]